MHIERIEIASLAINENEEVYNWVKDNIEPTYVDSCLKENLYSIDLEENAWGENENVELPDNVKQLVDKLKKESQNICYMRFVNF